MRLRPEQPSSPPADSDSQSDADSLTETLEQVGRLAFPTFSITPHLPTLAKLAALTRDYNTTSLGRKLAGLNTKKDELARIYAQLSDRGVAGARGDGVACEGPAGQLRPPHVPDVRAVQRPGVSAAAHQGDPEPGPAAAGPAVSDPEADVALVLRKTAVQARRGRRRRERGRRRRGGARPARSRADVLQRRGKHARVRALPAQLQGGVSDVPPMVHLPLLPRPGGAVAPAGAEPDQARAVHVLQHAAAGTALLRRLQPQAERVLLRHVQAVRQRPAEEHLPLRRLRDLSSRARHQPGLFPLQKLQHVHLDRAAGEPQVHRELDALQLPDLRRVHVQLHQEGGVHAVRPPDPPELLRRVHEALVQVSYLLAHDRQHGAAVPRAGQGDRRNEDARRHGRVDERGQVRRLRRQVARAVPLPGAQVRPLPELQHDAAAAAQVGQGRGGRRRRHRHRREAAHHTLAQRQLPVRRQARAAWRAADGQRQHRGLGLGGRLRGQLCARDQQLRELLDHRRRVQGLDQCVATQG
ncbi:hypothetical protein KL929_003983 [Ogataea haglerorum]|nr:hypothetical protein KL929_003983 [Ogataea haglerorum]